MASFVKCIMTITFAQGWSGAWAALAAAAGKLAASAAAPLMLAGCGESASFVKGSAPLPQAGLPADAPQGNAGRSLDEARARFQAHALNALLVPLLDDDVPPRWADPAFAMSCTAWHVTVDGAVPVPRAEVPAAAFVVRWQLEGCAPLGAGMVLSGDVELVVFHDGDSYSAHVRPDDLHVATPIDSVTFDRPFATRMPLLGPR